MKIPVYVVAGFLDSGKTTFLNNLLSGDDWGGASILALQFEAGEAELAVKNRDVENLAFSKKTLETKPEEIISQIYERLKSGKFDEIWAEWNGMTPFSELHAMLLHPTLRKICRIDRVAYVADAEKVEFLIGGAGGAPVEQIASCDFVAVRGANDAKSPRRASLKALFGGINPGVRVYDFDSYENLYQGFYGKKRTGLAAFFFMAFLFVSLFFASKFFWEAGRAQVNKLVNIFLGMTLQAVPFLLIGVHLSSAIEVFVSKSFIERKFPKTTGLGMLSAVAAGFCLPVCDCASIPIFRSLVRKGVPLPAAVTFMLCTPVINPVVIMSTYYAFGGNRAVVLGRVLLGVISAVLIGISFAARAPRRPILSGGSLGRFMCGCGCYEDAESIKTFGGKLGLFFRHAQAEFFDVGKYLMSGIFISSVFQTMGVVTFASSRSGAGLAVSMTIMMFAGFALSLCSSSDAVIARSFANQFPPGAIMAFLVFGPMIDIKNITLLSYGFSKRFITRLSLTVFIICFAAVFIFSHIGGW
jgi:uncharacterized membrane protein YraQ (UPF0718 family)